MLIAGVCSSSEIRKDLLWWYKFIGTFNGRSTRFYHTMCVYECMKKGVGDFFGKDWFYVNWLQDWPKALQFHINEKEVIAVALAVYRWDPSWRNKRIIIYSDNAVTVLSK